MLTNNSDGKWKPRSQSKRVLVMLMGVVLLTAQLANAAVNLRFTPANSTLSSGETGRLAIFIDDLDANVRTIDVHVTYDPSIVTSLDGGAGDLYTNSGFFVFEGIENEIPGQWHGYAVVMGSTDFLEGPGELFYWDFSALTDGVSPIIAVEAYVAAGDGTYYPEVVLEGTTIIVGDALSSVEGLPLQPNRLAVWPNPFNPRTSLLVDMPRAGLAEVAIYDLRGRKLFVMHEGPLRRGESVFQWDGRDSKGLAQPTGQYFFRLNTATGSQVTRATLIK
jgi:hypothetical protein